MELKELEQEQLMLAKKVVKEDVFSKLETIGGIESGFKFNKIFCGVIVCDYKNMRVLEKQIIVQDCELPYVSNFRAQRGLGTMMDVYNKLAQKPDVLLVNASGILHPRRLGLASHLGVKLDQATIGIIKKLLCGEVKDNDIILENEIVGKQVFTREKAKPIYVSIGHKISLDKGVEIVKKCMRTPHKMPEPLHLAHRLVREDMKSY